MEHPYQSKTQKSFSILLVLIITVAGGWFFTELVNQPSIVLDSLETIENYITPPDWVGVALSSFNYTENVVPIVITTGFLEESLSDGYYNIQLETVAKLAEEDINNYCKENNIGLQFEFIPFSILSREYAISEAADYLEELGVKLVVGFDNYHYEGMAETIGEKDIFFVSPLRSTSSIDATPQNWIGVRPPTRDGIVEAGMLTELGIEAVIVLQNKGSINGGSTINETYHDFKQTYEAQGGVIYDRINYPQPEIVSSISEGNSDFTKYLAEADSSMANAIQEYGLEHVGVFVIGFEPYPIAYQAKDFENLIKVPWSISYQMGFAVLGQNDMSQQMSLLKGYSTQEIVENIEAYLSLSEEARDYNPSISTHHGLFRIQEAVRYDACWLMALSVIEAGSSDPTTVQAVFPQVAAAYDGVNGNYRLDENMDRDNYVMGIVEIQEAPPDLIYSYVPVQIGVYHSDTGVINFHEPLSLYNITYP